MEGYQQGGGKERMGEKVKGLRSIIGRYKIDRGRLRIVWEMEKPKTYIHDPWTGTKGGIARGKGGTGGSGAKEENWDNCNSIINKICLKKLREDMIIQVKLGVFSYSKLRFQIERMTCMTI